MSGDEGLELTHKGSLWAGEIDLWLVLIAFET